MDGAEHGHPVRQGHRDLVRAAPAQGRQIARFEPGRGLFEWSLVALFACALVIALALGGGFARLDRLYYDALSRARPAAASDELVLVAIDNRSIEALGRWPWSREVHARFLKSLAAARPAAVGYDILFPEPSGPADAALAASIAAAGNVCLPIAVDPRGQDSAAWGVLPPIPALASAAAGLGQVNLTPDSDGIVRRAPLTVRAGGRRWPHLVQCILGRAGHTAAAASSGPVLIGYRGRQGGFRTASFIDLLKGEVPAAFLSGKLVLVGMTADGLGDRFATPVSEAGVLTPGIEIQAQLARTLLHGPRVKAVAPPVLALLCLIPLWIWLATALFAKPATNVVVGIAVGALALAASAAAFYLGAWASPTPVLAGLALGVPLWSWRRLAVASAFLDAEIKAFAEHEQALGALPADPVDRQVEAVRLALARLRQAARQREEFLQLLSHDMRAPQVSILALLEGGEPDAALRRRIAENAGLTLRIADQYVRLARLEAKGLEIAEIDLRQTLIEAADAVWATADAKGVRVETGEAEDEMVMRGDGTALTRALMNLIDNAVKASPQGGTVTCAVSFKDGHCLCRVADQGPGLTPQDFDRYRQPFSRGEKSAGVGLGLAYVQAVATRHGGVFTVEPNPGGGAVMSLSLPLSPPAP